MLEVPNSRPGFPETISALFCKALATPEWSWLLLLLESPKTTLDVLNYIFGVDAGVILLQVFKTTL